jgi:hypothetical protein
MGESDVIDAPRIAPIASSQDERWKREYLAFIRLLPELMRTHRDKYVAVHGGAVVAVGDSFEEAAVAGYKACGHVHLHVGQVTEETPPPVRLPSPRIVRSAEQP